MGKLLELHVMQAFMTTFDIVDKFLKHPFSVSVLNTPISYTNHQRITTAPPPSSKVIQGNGVSSTVYYSTLPLDESGSLFHHKTEIYRSHQILDHEDVNNEGETKLTKNCRH